MLPSRDQTSVPFFFWCGLPSIFPSLPVLPLDPEEDMVYLRFPTVVVDSFVPHGSTRVPSTEKQHKKQRDAGEKLEFEFQGAEDSEGKERGARERGGGRRTESRRKTRSLCSVTLEWQLEGLMIPRRESHRESLSLLPQRSLEYRHRRRGLAGGPKIVAIRSREWSRERVHKSTLRPFSVDVERRMFLGVSTRTSTRSVSV